MAYTKQEMTALIQVEPQEAKEQILAAYKKAKCSIHGAAEVLGCGERTVYRWMEMLNLTGAFAKMKQQALKEGWHHKNSRQGGRPVGTKTVVKRLKKRNGSARAQAH